MIRILIKRLPGYEDVPLPSYETAGAWGADLRAAEGGELLSMGDRALVKTGLSLEILTPGYEPQIRSRSGMTLKTGVIVGNSPATIDEDYRGDLGIILINTSKIPFRWRKGDRIAQLVICPVERGEFIEVGELSASIRGSNGFGSTGGQSNGLKPH